MYARRKNKERPLALYIEFGNIQKYFFLFSGTVSIQEVNKNKNVSINILLSLRKLWKKEILEIACLPVLLRGDMALRLTWKGDDLF